MEIPERPRLAWLAAFHEASLTPSGLRSLASLLRYFALVAHAAKPYRPPNISRPAIVAAPANIPRRVSRMPPSPILLERS